MLQENLILQEEVKMMELIARWVNLQVKLFIYYINKHVVTKYYTKQFQCCYNSVFYAYTNLTKWV